MKKEQPKIRKNKNVNQNEPTICQIIGDSMHPSKLIPDTIITISNVLISSTGFTLALIMNNYVQLFINSTSHDDHVNSILIAFAVALFVSIIGALFIRIGKKLRYDINKQTNYHSFDFDSQL